MLIISITSRDRAILANLESLGTIDPGYNAHEKILIFCNSTIILNFASWF